MKLIVRTLVRFVMATIFRSDFIPVITGHLKPSLLPRERALSQLTMLFGRYEPDFTTAFYVQAMNSKAIYDIGANFGYFTILAAKNPNAQIYSFEPVPELQRELKQVIKKNRISGRTHTVPLAISNFDGKTTLVTPDSDETGLISQALKGQQIDESKNITVDSRTLDSWLKESKATPPDLIKIDVEGAEAMVLNGASKTIDMHRPRIMVEVHGSSAAEQMWEFSNRNGYIVELLTQGSAIQLNKLTDWIEGHGMTKWKVMHVMLKPR